MFEQTIQRVALELLAGAVRHPDPATRSRLGEAFWDLQYLYRFGVPKIGDHDELPRLFPPEPQPDPSPIDRLKLHEFLLFGLADAILRDPDPQPALGDPEPQPNILSILGNKQIRLAGAQALAKRLATAQHLLGREIGRLQK